MSHIQKLLIFICFSTTLFSCNKHEKRETKYNNGQLHEQYSVLETRDESYIKDGEYKTWFPSGQPESIGQYKEGKLVGLWKYWYANGQLNLKLNFNEKGEKDGTQTEWHENAQKASEEHYLNGIKNGEFKIWDENGVIYVNRIFEKGKDINLPAKYINASEETLELLADETYKLTYNAQTLFGTRIKTKNGRFKISSEKLELIGFFDFELKKFSADTIILVIDENDVTSFIKKVTTKNNYS